MTYDQFLQELDAAPNDIIRRQVEDRWDKAFCAAVGKIKNFSNWTGHVQRINENGYFEVNLGGYLTLHDIGIVPGSGLYKVISGLRNNQPIKITEYFTHDAAVCRGIIVERDFGAHLTSVSPL